MITIFEHPACYGPRRVGKTTAICEAARKVDGTVACINMQDADRVYRNHNVSTVPVLVDPRSMRGRQVGPIFIDPDAVPVLIHKYKDEMDKNFAEYEAERNEYKAENTKLKIMITRLTDALALATSGDGTAWSAIPQTRQTLRKCLDVLDDAREGGENESGGPDGQDQDQVSDVCGRCHKKPLCKRRQGNSAM